MRMLGWRTWYLDGSVDEGATGEEAFAQAQKRPRGVLVRMKYFAGGGREIQMGCRHYFVAPHHSGEYVIGTSGPHDTHGDILSDYPSAVVQDGSWAPDGYYADVRRAAHASVWEGNEAQDEPCEGC